MKEKIAIAARHMNASDKVTVLPKWPTSYEQAIKETANWFKVNAGKPRDVN